MKSFYKTVLSVIAVAAAAVSLCAGASAYAGEDIYRVKGFNDNEIALAELFKSTLESFIEEEVDISKYNVTYDEFEDIYTTVLMNEPELYYVNVVQASLRYRSDEHILGFKPIYNCAYGELESRDKKIKKFSDSVMKGIGKNWSDEEKVLYVHDRLAAHITYYDGDETEFGRNIYDAFAKSSSVCVGYALGFQYFMDKLDIPCINVTTDDHIWNMVEIDGQWYHVDVTWDDSVEITKNTFMHQMILQSDESMAREELDHDISKNAETADDSFFENAFWTESNTRISYLGGYWYYTNKEGLNRYSFNSGESKLIYTISGVWHAGEDMDWKIPFSQTVVYGKSVYFNSPTVIYRYDTTKNKIYKVYAPKLGKNEQIYDIYISDGKLVYSAGTYDDNARIKKAVRLNKAS